MFGELPKLFGKEFLVGYFLPAAIVIITAAIFASFSGALPVSNFAKKLFLDVDEKKLAVHLGVSVVIVWGLAIFLLVANFTLVRVLEGYGALNPARLLRFWSLSIFEELNAKIKMLDSHKPLSASQQSERRRLRMRLSNEFPEHRRLVLPTRFGNIVRAFERYPQVIYNIDAIRCWTRLQALLPDSYKTSLDAAKSILDFYINLWFGGLVLASIAFGTLLTSSNPRMIIVGISNVFLAMLSAKLAQGAAAQWGELVKGAFDLYRGDLCKQLGFELPRSIEQERQMWAPICRTMIYRQSRYADKFTTFRPLPDRKM